MEAGERTPGPAAYNGNKNRYNSICYTFYKDPKHDPIGLPHIGPGTYETHSTRNSRLRASKSAFISITGVNKERMSLVLNNNPGPGGYRNKYTHTQRRSPSIQFDKGPRMSRVDRIKPGPTDYQVDHKSVMHRNESFSFTRS